MRFAAASFTLLLTALAIQHSAAAEVSARDKYILFCAGCHGFDGEGGGGGGGMRRIASFVDQVGTFLRDRDGRRYLVNVGGVSSAGMTDAETAIVLNYILGTFGRRSTPPDFQPYTAEEISSLRRIAVADPPAMRREISKRLEKRWIYLFDGYWN
jgi:mono/diheme cytochrome c family protein